MGLNISLLEDRVINMKTVIVTGGAGFIGSHLCEALLKKGNRVINIDNFNDFYNPSIKRRNVEETKKTCHLNNIDIENYIVLENDIRNIDFLRDAFITYKPDSVIHLAAYAGVRPSILFPMLYNDVNINGTMNILECLKEFGIKSFVFASSSSVYGNNEKVPFSESDFVDKPISPYAATKKAGELLCHTYHHLYQINMACLRFFTVYGPRQRPDLAIHKFTRLITEGKPISYFGDGSMQRDYTYIDDIIDGVTKALDFTISTELRFEVFNLGESKTIRLYEMVKTIEETIGKKAVIDRLPLQPGDVLRTWADVNKAKKLLGYKPSMPFEEGYKRFFAWFLNNA